MINRQGYIQVRRVWYFTGRGLKDVTLHPTDYSSERTRWGCTIASHFPPPSITATFITDSVRRSTRFSNLTIWVSTVVPSVRPRHVLPTPIVAAPSMQRSQQRLLYRPKTVQAVLYPINISVTILCTWTINGSILCDPHLMTQFH